MSFKMSDTKAKAVAIELYNLEKQMAELIVSVDKKKALLQQYFDEHNKKQFTIQDNSIGKNSVIVKKTERCTITYDLDKLNESLDREILNEITAKTYSVNDINGLSKLVRDAGISAKDFKRFINVATMVKKEEIKRLYDDGEISMDDLKGCYTAKVTKSIKFSESKGDTD